ncbi:BZ3501_MvSof-1269-A2-R1_Chr3-1g05180 [Microbotryum saponariae]|nr:BZ3501_MvSof-1269-A2-R1_Chr3-1g05180 [Microbotryum saponariae]
MGSSPTSATSGTFSRTFPDLAPGKKPGVKDVAQLIKQGRAKNVIVMAGAGISTAAGIPDFRSPETGLYANLEKYDLPYPEAIFDIDYFLEKPQAFYTLAKELYPGNFRPTMTHHFFRLLQDKGLLKAVSTQNIDTLERIAGVEDDKLIEAHGTWFVVKGGKGGLLIRVWMCAGSFESAQCLACKKEYSKEAIKPQIEKGEVVYCSLKSCKGDKKALVKPNIVFFGEGLPKRFFDRINDFTSCDLLIVLGTSLSVQPFASLMNRVPSQTPRLLINLESVGELSPHSSRFLGSRPDGFDFEDVDEGVLELVKELGWERELEELRETWEMGEKGKGTEKEDGDVETTVEEVREAPMERGRGGSKEDIEQLTERLEKVEVDGTKEEGAKEEGLNDLTTVERETTAERPEGANQDGSGEATAPGPGKAIL